MTMPTPVTLPEIGAGAEAIRISCWLVEPGETVERDDRVVEVVLQGMTFDVPAPIAGCLQRIDKPVDTVVLPGETLGWIEPDSTEDNS